MKQLLIATTNAAKREEIQSFLSDVPVEFVILSDLCIERQPEETGATFQENAFIKARFYSELTGLPALADDGGIEIDALGGAPGVHSHRWVHADRDDSDDDLINHAIELLRDVPDEKRGAQMRVVDIVYLPNGASAIGQGTVRGIIPREPSYLRVPGFPYRSLLYLPEICKFFNDDQLTPAEIERYNHRKRALESIKPFIMEHIC